jgi:two-component system KDP operon response regulator KdpE
VKVLVVDDDPRLRDALELGIQLQWQDAQVFTACDGQQGLVRFLEEEPDVVLLDITMPVMNGLELLQRIRRFSDVPVIMLSARGEDVDEARGLEMGADDYVSKPFSHAALMARIQAVLRRAELPPPVQAVPDFQVGELAIHFQNQEVTVAGDTVKLTPVEYRLLYHLVRNAGHLLPHRALLERVWGSEADASPEYLKVFVSRVRSKLRTPGGPEYIETERGRGYRFIRPEAVVRP